MNIFKLTSALVVISLVLPLSGQAQVITMTEFSNGLYDTGLGDATSGNNATTLGGGASDTHYIITSAPAGSGVTSGDALAVHQGNLPGAWVANSGATPPSRWDSTSATAAAQPLGTYDYQLTLTNITENSLVTISGNVAADNQIEILANGTQKFALTTNTTYANGFTAFSFTFNASSISTSDTLDFDVINTGAGTSATGLQVQGLLGTYSPVPEPRDSVLILLLGVGAVVAFRKLRRRFYLS